jgi:hypothetical protein
MTVTSYTVSQGATSIRPDCNIEEFLIKNILPDMLSLEKKNPILLADYLKFCLAIRSFVRI